MYLSQNILQQYLTYCQIHTQTSVPKYTMSNTCLLLVVNNVELFLITNLLNSIRFSINSLQSECPVNEHTVSTLPLLV